MAAPPRIPSPLLLPLRPLPPLVLDARLQIVVNNGPGGGEITGCV